MALTSVGTTFAANVFNLVPHNTVFPLPPLPYAYDALEPFIDKATMEIHHSKHHQAYVTNLNKAIAEQNSGDIDLVTLLMNTAKYNVATRNNAGGHFNHSLFWQLLKAPIKVDTKTNPSAPIDIKTHLPQFPSGKLAEEINKTFGSLDEFKKQFTEKAKTVFGSGWCWLIVNNENKLQICTSPNQDNPIMDIAEVKGKPIIALDVWEHAYYLKHQNKRADYIESFWMVLNWDFAGQLFGV